MAIEIEINYETTLDDWRAFQRHAIAVVRSSRAGRGQGLSWQSVAVGVVTGMAIAGVNTLYPGAVHVPTAAAVSVLILAAWLFLRARWATATVPLEQGAVVGPRRLVLDETGVRQESAHHTHHSAWPGIIGVNETDRHVFLMVDRLAAYIVPKRAFASPAAADEFLTFARAHAGTRRD